MKTILSLVLSVVFFTWISFAEQNSNEVSQGKIQQKYDRFKDATSINLGLTKIGEAHGIEAWLSAEFSYTGQTPTRPTQVILAFVFASKGDRFNQGDELILLLDGKRIKIGPMYRQASYDSTKESPVREIMAKMVPVDSFIEMARATKLEAKIGIVEFALSEDNLRLLREFIARIPS